MKRLLPLILVAMLAMPATAQPRPHQGDKKPQAPKIEEMVSNLTSSQRRRLLKVQEQSHERIDALHATLGTVRDSIRTLMHRDGDNSKTLFPLFDREAALQSAISKAMYQMRLEIDAILTPEQLAELRRAMPKKKK